MSFEDVAKATAEGIRGKVLLWIITSICGTTLYTVYFDHNKQLSGISQQVADLTYAVRDHDSKTDAAIQLLTDDDRLRVAAIAKAEQEILDLRNEPPRIERETMVDPAQRFTPIPRPLPAIGNAIQHLFSPPHHQWRRHP
jgi:hypothetical protein